MSAEFERKEKYSFSMVHENFSGMSFRNPRQSNFDENIRGNSFNNRPGSNFSGDRGFGSRRPLGQDQFSGGNFSGSRNPRMDNLAPKDNFGGERTSFNRGDNNFNQSRNFNNSGFSKPIGRFNDDRGNFERRDMNRSNFRDNDRPRFSDRGNFNNDRFNSDRGNSRGGFNDRGNFNNDRGNFGARGNFANGGNMNERRGFNDRPGFIDRRAGNFSERGFSDRNNFNDRGNFGGRTNDRPNFNDRGNFDRNSFNDRSQFNERPARGNFESRANFESRGNFEGQNSRESFNERSNEGPKFGGDREVFAPRGALPERTERPTFGNRQISRNFGENANADRASISGGFDGNLRGSARFASSSDRVQRPAPRQTEFRQDSFERDVAREFEEPARKPAFQTKPSRELPNDYEEQILEVFEEELNLGDEKGDFSKENYAPNSGRTFQGKTMNQLPSRTAAPMDRGRDRFLSNQRF
jgi:hypothetical protein